MANLKEAQATEWKKLSNKDGKKLLEDMTEEINLIMEKSGTALQPYLGGNDVEGIKPMVRLIYRGEIEQEVKTGVQSAPKK